MNIKNKANLTFQSPTTTYRNYGDEELGLCPSLIT